MSSTICGALEGYCPLGPKKHHKCGLQHKRVAGVVHPVHECTYCKETFA